MDPRHLQEIAVVGLVALATSCGGRTSSEGTGGPTASDDPSAGSSTGAGGKRSTPSDLPEVGPAPETQCVYSATLREPRFDSCEPQEVTRASCSDVACEWTVVIPRCREGMGAIPTPEEAAYLCAGHCRMFAPDNVELTTRSPCASSVDPNGHVWYRCGACFPKR